MRIDFEGAHPTIAAARRHGGYRGSSPLLAAIMRLARDQAELLRHAERSWASITFSGTRHTLALAFTGIDAVAAGEAFIAALPEHEFTIPGQLVADAAIVSVEQVALPEPRLTVEAELLLLDDC